MIRNRERLLCGCERLLLVEQLHFCIENFSVTALCLTVGVSKLFCNLRLLSVQVIYRLLNGITALLGFRNIILQFFLCV